MAGGLEESIFVKAHAIHSFFKIPIARIGIAWYDNQNEIEARRRWTHRSRQAVRVVRAIRRTFYPGTGKRWVCGEYLQNCLRCKPQVRYLLQM